MSVKFEQNRVVQTTQKFELFEKTNKKTNKKQKQKQTKKNGVFKTILKKSVHAILEDVSLAKTIV